MFLKKKITAFTGGCLDTDNKTVNVKVAEVKATTGRPFTVEFIHVTALSLPFV